MTNLTASKKLDPRPIRKGWALDALLDLDFANPGLLRFLHTASNLRRQAVFLVLARRNWDLPFANGGSLYEAEARRIASDLVSKRVRNLIDDMFGSTPPGLMGALSRCGPNPLEEFNYTLLHAVFDDPKSAPRRALLRHAPKINDDLVDVVWRLPKALLRVEVLHQIRCRDDIDQYASALKVLRRLHPEVSDEDFTASLAQMASGSTLARWIGRWIERADHLPPSLPFAGDEELRPLLSGAEIKDAARRFQNCLRRRVGDVALGRALYYEHPNEAIAELRGLSAGRWVLEGIYGCRNKQASPGTIRSIRAKLEAHGVLVPVALAQGPAENACADILGLYEFSGPPSLNWDRRLTELEAK